MPQTKNQIRTLKYVGCCVCVLAVFFIFFKTLQQTGFRILLSDSIPGVAYFQTDEPLVKGSYATFCPPLDSPALKVLAERGGLSPGNCGASIDFTKPVVALMGDTVTLTERGISVNGTLVKDTEVLPTDRSGRDFPHYPYGSYPVKKGEAWMISNFHPRSLDSRYFGPVPVNSLTLVKRIL